MQRRKTTAFALYSLAAGENGEAAGPKGGKEEANKLFSPSSRTAAKPPIRPTPITVLVGLAVLCIF